MLGTSAPSICSQSLRGMMLPKLATPPARQNFNQRQLHKALRANQQPNCLHTCQELPLGSCLSTNQSRNDQVRCRAWSGPRDGKEQRTIIVTVTLYLSSRHMTEPEDFTPIKSDVRAAICRYHDMVYLNLAGDFAQEVSLRSSRGLARSLSPSSSFN